jgi:putative hydrolase of the HAD superfamily
MEAIRVLAFDYGGTLGAVGPPVDVSLMDRLLRESYARDLPAGFAAAFSRAVQHATTCARASLIEQSLTASLDEVLAAMGFRVEASLAEVVDRYFTLLGDGLPDPAAGPVLECLCERGYGLLLAANTFRPRWSRETTLRQAGWLGYFRGILLSSELGFRKPHWRFYQRVVELSCVSSAEILFVGDTLENDVLAPVRFGMRSVWLTRRSPFEVSQLAPSCRSVAALRELLDLVS